MSLDDYQSFCVTFSRRTGLDLTQYKRTQMERRIRSFAERRGCSDLVGYLDLLASDAGELDALMDRITINVSQLFRNPEQWDVLGTSILPDLARQGSIRAWSAGCSYGAEAYSLAALARTIAPRAKTSIDATDIDDRVLARAREGWFSEDDARTAPAAQLGSNFDAVDGGWRASAELRRMVRFSRGDLLQPVRTVPTYDLILCRNVVIYFNEDAREQVHATLAASLRPGGYLVIGSTERITQQVGEIDLESVRPFIYRKLDRAA